MHQPIPATMVEQAEKLKFNKLGNATEFAGEAQKDGVARRVICSEVQIVLISPENAIKNPMYCNMSIIKCCSCGQ